jgi:hypothetical protein
MPEHSAIKIKLNQEAISFKLNMMAGAVYKNDA